MAVDFAVEDEAPTKGDRGLWRALGVGGLVAVLVVGIGLTAAGLRLSRHDAAESPASALYIQWPARGSLRDDTAAIAHAQHVWDYYGAPEREGPRNPHTDVRTLYAGRLDVGDLFVLQGTDRRGLPEVGFIFIPPRKDGWWVPEGVADIDMPAPQLTTHFAFPILTNMAGDDERLVVIGQPGTTTIGYSTVPDPDTVLPMYVEDGVGIAPIRNVGTRQVILANASGTYYQGRIDPMSVSNHAVGYTPPNEP